MTEKSFIFWKDDSAEGKTSCMTGFQDGLSKLFWPLALATTQIFHRLDGS